MTSIFLWEDSSILIHIDSIYKSRCINVQHTTSHCLSRWPTQHSAMASKPLPGSPLQGTVRARIPVNFRTVV
ncbi:hypothetical protein HZ326_30519 [Fusarium oxysporum f. sp. albedinis]|nr:hypothetical protein HZ326_30519 [Fusarium oxysporum f. sp. albedinis]